MLKFETSSEVRDEHQKNIWLMSVTWSVIRLDIPSNSVSFEQKKNQLFVVAGL